MVLQSHEISLLLSYGTQFCLTWCIYLGSGNETENDLGILSRKISLVVKNHKKINVTLVLPSKSSSNITNGLNTFYI